MFCIDSAIVIKLSKFTLLKKKNVENMPNDHFYFLTTEEIEYST